MALKQSVRTGLFHHATQKLERRPVERNRRKRHIFEDLERSRCWPASKFVEKTCSLLRLHSTRPAHAPARRPIVRLSRVPKLPDSRDSRDPRPLVSAGFRTNIDCDYPRVVLLLLAPTINTIARDNAGSAARFQCFPRLECVLNVLRGSRERKWRSRSSKPREAAWTLFSLAHVCRVDIGI